MGDRDPYADAVKPIVWMQTLREDPDVTGNRLLVLWALGMRMRKDGTGHAGQPRLMVDTGLGESAVYLALKWARDVGYLVRTRRGHRLGDGSTLASEYALTLSSPPVDEPVDNPPSTRGHARVDTESQPVADTSQPVADPVSTRGLATAQENWIFKRTDPPRVPSVDGAPDGAGGTASPVENQGQDQAPTTAPSRDGPNERRARADKLATTLRHAGKSAVETAELVALQFPDLDDDDPADVIAIMRAVGFTDERGIAVELRRRQETA